MKNYLRKVRKFLVRKRGPLATWVWAVLVAVGVVVYRRRKASQGSQQPGNNSAYTSPLSPPNLAYEPGGSIPVGPDNSGGGGNSDTAGLLALLTALIAQRNGQGHRGPKPKRKPPKKVKNGKWTTHKTGNLFRPRSHTILYNGWKRNRRTDLKGKKSPGTNRWRKSPTHKKTYSQQVRQRPRTPVVTPQANVTQRPLPAHTPRTRREPARPAPRPSSPPRRTVRRVGR